jgi:diguanylate cyclase (GGDEF)-like protein
MSIQENPIQQSQEPQAGHFRPNVELVKTSEISPRYKQLVLDAAHLMHKSIHQEQDNAQLSEQKTELTNKVEELEAETGTDVLTGLANKKAFRLAVDKAVERENQRPGAEGDETNIYAVRIDVDGFKDVNDTFGHAEGDEILKIIGGAIDGAVRSSDLPARGESAEETAQTARPHGDEFDVLIQDIELGTDVEMTKEQRAVAINNKLRTAVTNALASTKYSGLGVGISIGGAFYHRGEDIDEFLKRSDVQMYADKLARKEQRIPRLPVSLQLPVKIPGAAYKKDVGTSDEPLSA